MPNQTRVEIEAATLDAQERALAQRRAEFSPALEKFTAEREAKAELARRHEEGKAAIRVQLHATLDQVHTTLSQLMAPWADVLAAVETATAEARRQLYDLPCPAEEATYRGAAIQTMVTEHPLARYLAFLDHFRVPPVAPGQEHFKGGAS